MRRTRRGEKNDGEGVHGGSKLKGGKSYLCEFRYLGRCEQNEIDR